MSENYNVVTMGKTEVHKLVYDSKASPGTNFHTSILGTAGSGKTELSKQIFNYIPCSAFFVNTMRYKIKGTQISIKNWSHNMFPHSQGNKVKLSMAPQIHQDFDNFALEVKEMLHNIKIIQEVVRNKPLFIFIDEVQIYKEILNTLKDLVLMGRNYSMFLISISQRPQNIDKNIFSQSNMVYSLFDEFDYGYCKRLGINPVKVQQREFVYYPKANNEGSQYVMRMKL